MKNALVALAAVLLSGIGWPQPAAAQGTPPGSYLQSCSNIDMRGNTLTATCRGAGGQLRSSLSGVNRCAGDIGNNNGVLQCSVQGGGQARGQVVQGPGGGPRDEDRGSRRERCRELNERAADLRAQRDWAWYPDERARFDRRLRRVQEDQREARCRS